MVIEMKNVVKRYKELVALDHFNLSVQEGQIYGLLGPNGSGKSTAINCILALLHIDKGDIEVFGRQITPTSYELKRNIGLVPQEVAVLDQLDFYALLAMTCLGACSSGAITIIIMQADKSREGARMSASSANKWGRTAAAGAAAYTVQLAMSLIVLAYMALVLGKGFGDQTGYVILVVALGTLMGYLLGMAIASLVRGSDNLIMGLTTGSYLFSSFLAGLMSHDVKHMIDKAVPMIGQINPASMITDALYSLYYFDTMDFKYVYSMLAFSAILVFLTSLALRRRYHDSI